MGKRVPIHVTFTEKQRAILEAMKRGSHSPLHLIHRSSILLLYGEGMSTSEISRQLATERNGHS